MEYKTFKDWKKAGYRIDKGSKATWINGVAHFSQNQVTYSSPGPRSRSIKTQPFSSRRYYYDGQLRGEQAHFELSREDDADLADFYDISPWGGD